MAKLVFGMNLSLDGYVDHDKFAPDPVLFGHWTAFVRGLAGSLYGRRLYDIMRYWDEDCPEWSPELHAFAQAWRRQPKWVVSRTLTSAGPNATLIAHDLEAAVRRLKEEVAGEIQVGGPVLAHSLGERGLIDEYRLILPPGGAWRRHAVLRRRPVAASSRRQRSDRRGNQADIRSRLSRLNPLPTARAAAGPAPTGRDWPAVRD